MKKIGHRDEDGEQPDDGPIHFPLCSDTTSSFTPLSSWVSGFSTRPSRSSRCAGTGTTLLKQIQ